MYPTLESTIGNTPLVRLQRLPGTTSNVILAKLEGDTEEPELRSFLVLGLHPDVVNAGRGIRQNNRLRAAAPK
jgi:cysteine synthase B